MQRVNTDFSQIPLVVLEPFLSCLTGGVEAQEKNASHKALGYILTFGKRKRVLQIDTHFKTVCQSWNAEIFSP